MAKSKYIYIGIYETNDGSEKAEQNEKRKTNIKPFYEMEIQIYGFEMEIKMKNNEMKKRRKS